MAIIAFQMKYIHALNMLLVYLDSFCRIIRKTFQKYIAMMQIFVYHELDAYACMRQHHKEREEELVGKRVFLSFYMLTTASFPGVIPATIPQQNKAGNIGKERVALCGTLHTAVYSISEMSLS